MVILNPLEPWPGELVLPAAERHDVELITRVVDYGGLFHDDVLPGPPVPASGTTARSGPQGWIERGRERLERDAPDRRAPRADDAAARVRVEPRPRARALRRADADPGAGRRTRGRSRTSAPSWPPCRRVPPLSAEEVAEIRAIGDNTGRMALKGAAPGFDGEPRAGPLAARRRALPRSPGRWGIEPERDLVEGLTRRPVGARCRCSEAVRRRAARRPAALPRRSPPPPPRTTLGGRRTATRASSSPSLDVAGDGRAPSTRAAGTEDEGLPLTWCGDERTTDDVAQRRASPPRCRSSRSSTPTPSDRAEPLRRSGRTRCRPNVSLIGRFMGAQSGGRKTPRFDMGTELRRRSTSTSRSSRCRARAATYVDDFDALEAAVARAAHPRRRRSRATSVVLADRLSSSPRRLLVGHRRRAALDERPARATPHNAGGLFSALWVPDARARARRRPRTAGGPRACCTR